MKHTLRITLSLVLLFMFTQFLGLYILGAYIDFAATSATGKTTLYDATYAAAHFTPPVVENESSSVWYILLAVLVGTCLVLLIIKFRKRALWKVWFSLSVFLCLVLGLTPFIAQVLFVLFAASGLAWSYMFTLVFAAILAYLKIFRKNVYIHNFTELFIYGGLASLIVPILNMFSVVLLLLLISVYDAYAVWKSKHMVAMAQFQTAEKTFAGLLLPYQQEKVKGAVAKQVSSTAKKTSSVKSSQLTVPTTQETSVALLGGGDLAFPLLFSGVVLKTTFSYGTAISISLFAAAALFSLLYFGKKDRFYPAMPFITVGCFVGYAIGWIVFI